MTWTLSETDKAYAAGIVDGEGSIMIPRALGSKRKDGTRGLYWGFRIEVTVTDESLIEWLHDHWPGTLYDKLTPKPHQKQRYTWILTAQRAENFLRDIQPYLVIKAPQAVVALDYRSSFAGRGTNNITDQTRAFRHRCRDRIHVLNQRGVV